MKKWIYAILILSSPAYGEHLVSRNANNLTIGTLPNARLDPSSVTLQGNALSFSDLSSSIAAINSSTNTSFTNLKSTSVQVSNFINTAATSYIQISTSVQSLAVMNIGSGTIQNFNSQAVTTTFLVVYSTMSSSTANFGTFTVNKSTNVVLNQTTAQAAFTASITSVTVGSGGVTAGGQSSFNNVAISSSVSQNFTVNYETVTNLNVASGLIWPDGTRQITSPAAAISLIRHFDGVVVGTVGALNVDATIGSKADWITVLSSFGMAGLTQSTTAQGKIFLRNGNYVDWIDTVPAGATVLCNSSAVMVLAESSARLLLNYGTFGTPGNTCNIDGSNQTFTNFVVSLGTGSRSDLKLYGMKSQGSGAGAKIVDVRDSTGVIANLNFSEFTTVNAVTVAGDRAGFNVLRSTKCVFNIKSSSFIPVASSLNGGGLVIAQDVTECLFNFDADMVTQGYLVTEGIRQCKFTGKMTLPEGSSGKSGDAYGIITIGNSVAVSTASVFNIDITAYGSGGVLNFYYLQGATVENILISGSLTDNNLTNTHTGVNIAGSCVNISVNDLYTWNLATSVTDSGTTTTLNYWRNGKHPFNN